MNSTAIEVDNALALSTTMPSGRLLYTYLTEARYEFVRTLRTPAFAIPFLVLPVALYLFFGVVLAGSMSHGDPKIAIAMYVSWSVFGVMGPGMFGLSAGVALERDQGLLALKRALPMPPAAYLLGKMLTVLLFAAIIMVTLIVAALFVGHPGLTAGQYIGIMAIDISGALPFCAMGLFIGTRMSGKAAPAIANLIYLMMIYLSGLFFPLPKGIKPIEFALPGYYLDQLTLWAAGVPIQSVPILHVAVLAGVTLLLVALSVRRLARGMNV